MSTKVKDLIEKKLLPPSFDFLCDKDLEKTYNWVMNSIMAKEIDIWYTIKKTYDHDQFLLDREKYLQGLEMKEKILNKKLEEFKITNDILNGYVDNYDTESDTDSYDNKQTK
jgi:hypothetical protein